MQLKDNGRFLRNLFPAKVDSDYRTRCELRLSSNDSGCSLLGGCSDNAGLGEKVATEVPCSGNREIGGPL